MSRSKKSAELDLVNFVANLRNLLNLSLTDEKKQQVVSAFSTLIDFLTQLRDVVQQLPSLQDADQTKQSLLALEQLVVGTNEKAAVVDAKKVVLKQKKKKKIETETPATINVKDIIVELEKMTAEGVISRLVNRQFSISDLRAIAIELGLVAVGRSTRLSLVNEIATFIERRITYRKLANHSHSVASSDE